MSVNCASVLFYAVLAQNADKVVIIVWKGCKEVRSDANEK